MTEKGNPSREDIPISAIAIRYIQNVGWRIVVNINGEIHYGTLSRSP